MKQKIEKIIQLTLPVLLTIFIWHNFKISGNNILFILILIALYYLVKTVINRIDKTMVANISVISICFTIATLIGKSISIDYTLNNIFDKWIVINAIGYFSMAFILIYLLYDFFDKNKLPQIKLLANFKLLRNNKAKFIATFLLISLAWLPYLLRYYPGIITPDSNWQMQQALGLTELSNHHSIIHTGIISIALNLGKALFNSIEAGLCIYSVISIIIMAFIDTCILQYLSKKNVPVVVRILALLYYMFYPMHAYYSITMWKDIFFSGMFGILFILFIELVTNTEDFLAKKRNIAAFVVVSILVIYLRSNGLYCILLAMPFVCIVLRKYWKKILAMFSIILVLYFIINTLMYNVFNIIKVATGEALSIPVQQIARVDKNHRDELDEETRSEIYSYFNYYNIGDYYNPTLSDDVKFKFKSDYFDEHKGEFIGLWFGLFTKYPKDYFESFFSNSYGYYYVEAQNNIFSNFSNDNGLDLVQRPLTSGNLLDQVLRISEYSTAPIYSMLFSIGFVFWLMVACMGYKIYKKETKYILLYIPLFVLWLTMIASPVFCEYRYAYPLFICMPIFTSINLIKKEN